MTTPLLLDVTVPRRPLTRHLLALTKSLPRKGMNAEPDLHLGAEGSSLRMSSWDPDAWMARALLCAIATPGKIRVPGKRMATLLDQLPGDQVRITAGADQRVRVEALGGRAFTLPGVAAETSGMRMPLRGREPSLRIQAAALRGALGRVLYALGKTDAAPNWSRGLHLRRTDGNLRLTSCDGFRVAAAILPMEGPVDDETDPFYAQGLTLRTRSVSTLFDLLDEILDGGSGHIELFADPTVVYGHWAEWPAAQIGLGVVSAPWPKLGPIPIDIPTADPACVVPAEILLGAITFVLEGQSSERSPGTVGLRASKTGTLGVGYYDDATRILLTEDVPAVIPRDFELRVHGTHLAQALRGLGAYRAHLSLHADPKHDRPTRRTLRITAPDAHYTAQLPVELG